MGSNVQNNKNMLIAFPALSSCLFKVEMKTEKMIEHNLSKPIASEQNKYHHIATHTGICNSVYYCLIT